MTFAECIPLLLQRHIIRRTSWAHYEDIYISDWGHVVFDVTLTDEDLEADDWEVVK